MKTDPRPIDFNPFPWSGMATSILTQMKRWGQIKGEMNYAQIAREVFLTADAERLTPPTTTERSFSAMGKVYDRKDPEEKELLMEIPYHGSLPTAVPTDPLIYRFYELVSVYGTTWKDLIHEEFGDGIMSAIDFDMTMERLPDPKGDRVKISMTGKFLPYRRY